MILPFFIRFGVAKVVNLITTLKFILASSSYFSKNFPSKILALPRMTALLTKITIYQYLSIVSFMIVSASSSMGTSALITNGSLQEFSPYAVTAFIFYSFLPTMVTSAPSLVNCTAAAAPIPELAPVIITTLPVKLITIHLNQTTRDH